MSDSLRHSEEINRIRDEYNRREMQIPRDFYSLKRPGNLFIYNQRIKKIEQILKPQQTPSIRQMNVLEIGCGRGQWFSDLQGFGVDPRKLHGIELDQARLEEAKRYFPKSDLRNGDASRLPWEDATFDLVLQATVFTSILSEDVKKKIAQEMLRVLKPSGMILWYDFFVNNPWNHNVQGVAKKEIEQLFPCCSIQLQKITLAPPVARLLAPLSFKICSFLESLKIFNSHYLGVIRKI